MKKVIFFFMIIFIFSIDTAWAVRQEQPEALKKLLDVDKIKTPLAMDAVKPDNNLRLKAIKEAAQALGVEGGYNYQYDMISKSLDTIVNSLDKIYNFEGYLMHRGKVLPAIIAEAGPAERKANSRQLIFAQKTFKIIKDSEVVLAKPNWRTYLKKPAARAFEIHHSLYPVSKLEKELWRKEINEGWRMGKEQAFHVFEISLNRLTRDITGLINFRILSLQKIVATPFLAMGTTDVEISKAGKKLQIGKTVYRIVNNSRFEDADTWTVKTTWQ